MAKPTLPYAYRSPRTRDKPDRLARARSPALQRPQHPAQRPGVNRRVDAQRYAAGQHDLDQPLRARRRWRLDRRRRHRRGRHRRWCAQLHGGEAWRRPGRGGTAQAHHLPAPRIELPRADPVLARHVRRRQLGAPGSRPRSGASAPASTTAADPPAPGPRYARCERSYDHSYERSQSRSQGSGPAGSHPFSIRITTTPPSARGRRGAAYCACTSLTRRSA